MIGRIARPSLLIALVLGLAACGGNGEETTTTFDTDTTLTTTTETTATTTTTGEETTKLRVYFLLNGKVQPVAREVPSTQAVADAALDALLAGPNADEQGLGLESALPPGVEVERIAVTNGQAQLRVSEHLDSDAMAQVVYTLTQFPTVTRGVEVQMPDATLVVDRADYEDKTPAILVESPLPFETVGNPLHATGTANTFEANFEYEVIEPEGRIVDSHFVTATSGTGTRGTFDFTSRPYEISREGLGALIVLERSAKDGSRINLVEIPVRMVGQATPSP